MANTNYVEHEGEILPSYTGVNQPRYPRHEGDTTPDHDFGHTEITDAQSTVVHDTEPTKHENPYWPTTEQRAIGKAAIQGIRETMKNSTQEK